jgi:hypothetical protein
MRAMTALLMILWLPLQGFAAVAMPFCQHAMQGRTAGTAVADPHARHAAHQHHQPTSAKDAQPPHDSGALFACNDCGVCHLACTPAAPLSVLCMNSDATYAYSERIPALPPLFIPEQLHRPPLAVRA